MVACVPELRLLFRALEHEDARAERQQLYETLGLAYRAALLDPALARLIKVMLRNRVAEAISQVHREQPSSANFYLNQAIERALTSGVLDDPNDVESEAGRQKLNRDRSSATSIRWPEGKTRRSGARS
jgi:hypothetical protein